MPMLAHFEDIAEKSERRRTARRALRLGVGGNGEPVTIHDLSLTGALLETSAAMLVGSALALELSQGRAIEAVVVWNSGEFYGCQFDLPIAPSVLSAALLQSEPQGQEGAPAPTDPIAELKQLNAEVEMLALKMDRALRRLARK
jgi:hypothetical protein